MDGDLNPRPPRSRRPLFSRHTRRPHDECPQPNFVHFVHFVPFLFFCFSFAGKNDSRAPRKRERPQSHRAAARALTETTGTGAGGSAQAMQSPRKISWPPRRAGADILALLDRNCPHLDATHNVQGGSQNGTPRTDHFPFRPDIRTSYNSRISSPFDESQLPNAFQ